MNFSQQTSTDRSPSVGVSPVDVSRCPRLVLLVLFERQSLKPFVFIVKDGVLCCFAVMRSNAHQARLSNCRTENQSRRRLTRWSARVVAFNVTWSLKTASQRW